MLEFAGFTPEPTEFPVLALWGGMGTGPLREEGARGSIALGILSLD